MRFALVALSLLFTAPAFAQRAVHFPEKLSTTGFQGMIADAGPAYVAGQPTEQALRDMAAQGIKTVINLRTQPEMDNRKQVPYDEAAVAKELGITYVHIPLGDKDHPYSPEALKTFGDAMEKANGKVLLHCTVAWRASNMWSAYLVKYTGMTYEDAVKHGEAMNLSGYKPPGNPATPLDGFLGRAPQPAPQ
jgi:uncharacterized protein (TIGR01244 family)